MNIYERKSKWKLWLLFFAAMIVGASLWYTSVLAGRIAEQEKDQVKIWAQAVRNNARLLEETNKLFERLANEERKKVKLWADATNRLIEAEADADIEFALEVVTNNETVPVILMDEKGRVVGTRNVDDPAITGRSLLPDTIIQQFTSYPPIVNLSLGMNQYIYYKDSRVLEELKTTIRNLIQSFISEIVLNSASVPVIFTDSSKQVLASGNIDTLKMQSPEYLQKTIKSMENENNPIVIDIGGDKNYVYYRDSYLLKQITIYPYIQFAIIGIFLLIAYYAFNTARKVEQNQVWVGMSKETAHQLGTPISSLMAWVEYFKEKGIEKEIIEEVDKDVVRLELITERFSKIGSSPALTKSNLKDVLDHSLVYLQARASKKVVFKLDSQIIGEANSLVNPTLFDWVIENLVKNALDAMDGVGTIEINIGESAGSFFVDITDSGKGIPKSKMKTVFEPGYSTKKRGWGLGLSLSKRIIENYHSGKIFVKESTLEKGTTFRITLPKA